MAAGSCRPVVRQSPPARKIPAGRRSSETAGIFPGTAAAWLRQVHSCLVVVVRRTPAGIEPSQPSGGPVIPEYPPPADALVSGEAGLWLSVQTADCLPVLLFAPGTRRGRRRPFGLARDPRGNHRGDRAGDGGGIRRRGRRPYGPPWVPAFGAAAIGWGRTWRRNSRRGSREASSRPAPIPGWTWPPASAGLWKRRGCGRITSSSARCARAAARPSSTPTAGTAEGAGRLYSGIMGTGAQDVCRL